MADTIHQNLSTPQPVSDSSVGTVEALYTGTLTNPGDTLVIDVTGAAMATIDVSGTFTAGTFTITRTTHGGQVLATDLWASSRERRISVPVNFDFVLPETFVVLLLGLQTLTITAGAGFAGPINLTVWTTSTSRFVSIANDVLTDQSAVGSSTPANVAQNVADVTLLATHTSRRTFTLYNDASANLRVLLNNSVSSATNFSFLMPPGSYYEDKIGWKGVVKGIWDGAGAGACRVMEYNK